MATNKIRTVFLVFISIQAAIPKSTNDISSNSLQSSEEEMEKLAATPSQKLFMYTFEHFVPLVQNFAKNLVNVSRYILKDELVVANTKTDVVNFKENVASYVETYDATKGHIYTQDILNIYSNITQYYELPEKKITTETTFIIEILNKYKCKDVIEKFIKEFTAFKDGFIKSFEEKKAHLEKPLMDWYEKYNSLTDLEQRFEAFSDFLKLA